MGKKVDFTLHRIGKVVGRENETLHESVYKGEKLTPECPTIKD